MNIRYELAQYPFIAPKIKELELEVIEIIVYQRDARDTLRASIWCDLPRSNHMPSNSVLEAVIKVLDTFAIRLMQIQDELTELYARKLLVDQFLKKLDPLEKRAVELSFFQYRKINEVATNLHMSINGAYSLIQRALINAQKG